MNSNSKTLFSNNSPWKDGIEPVFQTGQFPQQMLQYQQFQGPTMTKINRHNSLTSNHLQISNNLSMQRPSQQNTQSQINNQANLAQPQNQKDGARPNYYKEQLFDQAKENTTHQDNTHSGFQYVNEGHIRSSNQSFQTEAAKLVATIQNNLMGIISGIQNNIVKNVNANVNHQLKKQRYLVRKKHQEIIQFMNDQEIVHGAKFPQKYSSVEKQSHGVEYFRANQSSQKREEDFKFNQREEQNNRNSRENLNVSENQKYNIEYQNKRTQQNRDAPQSASYQNKNTETAIQTIKEEDDYFNSNHPKVVDNKQTIKNSDYLGNINNSNNNQIRTTVSRKQDQLLEDSNQFEEMQQNAIRNEFPDDGVSLAYTLDDEISKNSIFFGANRESIALDQSKKFHLSKNSSQIQQQKKNQFYDVEEVDLDEIYGENKDTKSKLKSSQTPNISQIEQQKGSKIQVRSPYSEKYSTDKFEELFDEDEVDDFYANNSKKQNKPETKHKTIKTNSNQKQSQNNQNDDDDAYKYDSNEFDLDDF